MTQKRPERGLVVGAMIASGAMIALQVAGKAARDALFLSSFDVTMLPRATVLSAALSIVGVLALGRLMTRYAPARVVPLVFVVSAALLAGEWWLARTAPRAAAFAVYLHMAFFGATSISGFWSLVNERFDPHTARQVVGRIAAAGTLGGLVGGASAWAAAGVMPVATMLPCLAGVSLVAAAGALRVGLGARSEAGAARAGAAEGAGVSIFVTLARSRYLQTLGVLTTLGAMTSTLIDYVFNAEAAAQLGEGPGLLSFFAVFYTVVGLASFGVQASLSRLSLERMGLAGTVALTPGSIVAGALLCLFAPGLVAFSLMRGLESALRGSLFRSAYELFYTPVAEAEKRATKTWIDVGLDRVGAAIGSGLTMLVLLAAPEHAGPVLIALAMGASMGALSLTGVLHRGYVGALGASLRSGALSLDPNGRLDATTRRTLSETMETLGRAEILGQIQAMRGRAGSEGAPSVVIEEASPAFGIAGPPVDAIAAAASALRSRDAARARAVLAGGPLDVALVAHVIPLLADDGLHAAALRALRTVAPRVTGQLTDALLDPAQPMAVRRRLPRVLRTVPTRRAAEGLLEGLDDERFEVRYECGVALMRLVEREAQLALPQDRVTAAAVREIDRGQKIWATTPDGAADGPRPPGRALRDRSDRSLELVFALLSLMLDREPLKIAYQALGQGDERLRGTALEYLENVLPEAIRAGLWPYLEEAPGPRSKRPGFEVLEDLRRSMGSVAVHRGALSRRSGQA